MASEAKSKSLLDRKQGLRNPWGQFRKQPSVEEFAACFTTIGGVAVQREHCNDTASWVERIFPSIELEVHQAGTLMRAAKEMKQEPDYEAVRKNWPRLSIVATDADLKLIESGGRSKDVTASILSRILDRRESSIKRWAQGKK